MSASGRECEDLARLCRALGADPLVVQAGGGNGSIKTADGGRMWIKASGIRLRDVSPERGIVLTDREVLAGSVRRADAGDAVGEEGYKRDLERSVLAPERLRPSMESGFHAVLGRAVLHTHPVFANAFTCMCSGREAAERALGGPVAWVSYHTPGLELSVAVHRAAQEWRQRHGRLPDVVFLENHGLIACGQTVDEAVAATRRVLDLAAAYFGAVGTDPDAVEEPDGLVCEWAAELARALAEGTTSVTVRPARRRVLLEAAGDEGVWPLAGALVPDDIVYGANRVRRFSGGERPRDWLAAHPLELAAPHVLFASGRGAVLVAPTPSQADGLEEMLVAHVLVRTLIARKGEPARLPGAAADAIDRLESERYRRAVAKTL